MSAMMADKRLPETVIDEPGRALRALESMAARAAQSQRRIAATVQKKQRLFTARNGLADLVHKARRDPFAARGRGLAQIDAIDLRHGASTKTRVQFQMFVAALLRIDARFNRGRGGGQNDGSIFNAPPHNSHVAGMIGNAVILFVGSFMFFIDDDGAQIFEWQKEGGARAGDNPHRTICNAAPDARTFARCDT